MSRFIIRRFFTGILTIVAATLLIFFMSRVYGDPLALLIPDEGYGFSQTALDEMKKKLRLDRAVPIQYVLWVGDMLRGDFGLDLTDRSPLRPKVLKRLRPTLLLAVPAFLLATVLGIPLGILSALRRGTRWDLASRVFAIGGQSVPPFWLAIMGILVFAVFLNLLPAGTMGEGLAPRYFILPTLVIAWFPMSGYVRLVRSAMLEVLDSEYVKLARAKGVPEISVIWKHGFRNALIAPLTYGGLLLAAMLNGSVAVETVFAWPGIARWGVSAVWTNNFPVLAVVVLMFTLFYVVVSFTVDILYAVIDPRVRYS